MKEQTRALIAEHGDADDSFLALVASAEDTFADIDEYLALGYAAGLNNGGLWECKHCGQPVEDPAHPDSEVGCVMLYDEAGCGDIILCQRCHDAAVQARQKIVVTTITDDPDYGGEISYDEEDDSALTADEKVLAGYIERSQRGQSRQSRDLISSYPRDERRQLHRYQDAIDADRNRSGKTIRK